MKINLLFKRGLLIILMLIYAQGFSQLFTQDFNSSTNLSSYVNATAPTNGQFNSIGTSGSGVVVSINANQLRFSRTNANAGSYSRTTDFSPVPTSLIYKFDITVSGNSTATTSAAEWQVGSGFGTANSAEANSKTYARIGLNLGALPGEFSLRNIGVSNSATFSGPQTVIWYINNSGATLSYLAPNGTVQNVSNDTFDVWVGNVQVFDDLAATTATVDLKNIKFIFSGGTGTIDLDNISVDPFPTTNPTIATGGVASLSGFVYNEGVGPAISQYFTLSASNLAPVLGSVTVAPPSDYEISTDNITFTSSSLLVSYTVGSIPQSPPTRIYVRLKAGLPANTYNNQNITLSGGSAPVVHVTCNGTVLKPSIALGTLSSTAMIYPVGSGPSPSANATVAGTNLNGNVLIVPDDPSKWEVSTNNTSWGSSAAYIPSGETLAASANRIYTRLKAGLPVGNYTGSLIAGSPNALTKTIAINGMVTQPLIQINQLSQDLILTGFSYDFAQGPSPTQSFRVDGSNLAADITATVSENWEISSNLSYDDTNSFPFTTVVFAKTAGGGATNKTLHVRLKNGLAADFYSGTLTLTSANAITRTVTLSGEVLQGKADMKVLGGTATINDGSTVPSSLNRTLFATQNIGDSQIKSYTITNRGGAGLILGEIIISGTDALDFSIVNFPVPGTQLLQGQNAIFEVRFAPTTAGLKTATVEISNNDPDKNPYDFVIKGNAVFCGAAGTLVIAQQGFEEIPAFSELTYTVSHNTDMYGLQTGFSMGKSASGDKPAGNNLYADGVRGFRIQGGSEPNGTLMPLVLEFDAVDTSIYSAIDLSFKVAAFSLGGQDNGMDNFDATGAVTTDNAKKMDYVLVEISPDGGITWYKQVKIVSGEAQAIWGFNTNSAIIGQRDYRANNNLTYFNATTAIPYNRIVIQNIPAVPSLKIRISAQDNAERESWILDDIRLESTGIVPKVWNGTTWFPSVPIKSDKVIINKDYNTGTHGSLKVCQCEINNATLTVSGNTTIIVSDQLINNGNIIVENDASFMQVHELNTNSGTGTFSVKRNSNLKRLDYTYWASPVRGQNLKAFSPGTLNTRFYTYNEGNDLFEVIPPDANIFGNNNNGVYESAAKGYAIRANNNYPAESPPNPAPMQVFTGVFKGSPNNGEITFPLKYHSPAAPASTGDGYNLVGNPYPSNLDFYRLADHNRSTIQKTAYFWTNLNPNPVMQGSNYPNGGYYNNYAVLNGTGGIPATLGEHVSVKSATPTRIIKVGQGFLVKAKQAGTLTFKNAVRTEDTNSVFFNRGKNEETEILPDRFWLHLTTPMGVVTTALIGYLEEAANEFDEDFDANLLGLGADALFTKLGDHRLGIQGRAAPLNSNDIIYLGTNHYEAGNHTLAVGAKEGIFADGKDIYLKDKQAGIITNLSAGDYTFETNAGESNGRFEIIYQPETVLATDTKAKEGIVVYRDQDAFVIKSPKTMTMIQVYDVSGKLITVLKPNNKKEILDSSGITNGVYVVKITTTDGEVTNRKIIR
ncbi:choice-of-anchor D domain-containing protein [Chryseobacterium sp. MDT2-18]|uniref:choice-of-anchor D domain-containing protein n=1 Tax=Chryseobacterium sp. MDT2-18 TaxID=1259136 RepID=UPI0027896EC8|nr:choice-of-anchor D domain-containing protein [Chryseobacterium sp. MDT2-18]MDQ0476856.1 hypothetical protein [Chryseobacterium sp. MDT2-18]